MDPSLIARIDRWLANHRPEYYAMLQPGVTESALDAFEQRFRIKLPDSFRSLYRWRNGQRMECYDGFIDHESGEFSPLESIATTKEMLDSRYEDEELGWWSRTWVPFLDYRDGDLVCLDLGAKTGC
jgi:cell wall assembly regulator SMI1